MLKTELKRLKSLSLNEFTDVVDISDIDIGNGSVEEKVNDFLGIVRNPYIFKVGDLTVKVNFNGDKPFSEALVKAVNYA